MTAPDRDVVESKDSLDRSDERLVDPRSVRVSLASTSAHAAIGPMVVEPPAVPLAPSRHPKEASSLGGVAELPRLGVAAPSPADALVLVDGEPDSIHLDHFDPVHGVIAGGAARFDQPARTAVIILPADGSSPPSSPGAIRREVIVDGWRIEVEVESERRASLRERARRGHRGTTQGGPTEVRAIIPGVVATVSVVPGDMVVAGQQLLVVEAMKMQNDLRSPRDGVITRVAVASGQTIEVGDILLVLD